MVYRHIIKVRKGIINFGHYRGWKWKTSVVLVGAILVLTAVWWIVLPLPQNYETEIPLRAKSYSATPIACEYDKKTGGLIEIKFTALEPAQNLFPEYSMEEIEQEAKTVVTFERVSRIDQEFDYEEIITSPLIDSIDYRIENNRLVIEIRRKGPYLPAHVDVRDSVATIILEPAVDNYPVISDQRPAADAAVFPATRPISFNATLASPLKNTFVFFQNKPVEFATSTIEINKYHFSFEKTLENGKEYSVKAIISDHDGRTSISSWNFVALTPSEAALGKDRFKYLGWWGQINANGVSVRKGVALSSDKLGTLSSANRVKVIKEVYGDWVDGKNLWYQIDGGVYPGAYVFSEYVMPMVQPAPPEKFIIPDGINSGQKWIDVNLTKKVLTLFDYDKPMFVTYISPGRDENPTEPGAYRVWYKLTKADMKGGPPLHTYRYHLKNIPWVMYYNYDYAIHGTYWHDKFGMPQSAGCTNMTQGDAKYIFDNTLPTIPDDKKSVFSTDANLGTVVFNHE